MAKGKTRCVRVCVRVCMMCAPSLFPSSIYLLLCNSFSFIYILSLRPHKNELFISYPAPPSPFKHPTPFPRTVAVRLISAAGTGFFYTFMRPRGKDKLVLRKYDPKGKRMRYTSGSKFCSVSKMYFSTRM